MSLGPSGPPAAAGAAATVASSPPKPGSLKLTLRMKNQHYEILRTEGILENCTDWTRIRMSKKKKSGRKREFSNSSTSSSNNGGGLKRLKLRLGDETMSTIDFDNGQ